MDFHSLSRKELQTLCKRNKIPANTTNVAMADALTALTDVEGIEDITRPTTLEPESPHTCLRTSTRQRPIKDPVVSIENEPESSQILTRTRRGTARRIKPEEEQEKNAKNPSGSEIPQTPVTRNCPKRGTRVSVRRQNETHIKEDKEKVCDEVQEKGNPVVGRVYSTRRSSRLTSQTKMSESIQKRGGRRTEAIKIAAFESEDLVKKSKEGSEIIDVIDEVQEEEATEVLCDREDRDLEIRESVVEVSNADQALVSEDALATVISAEIIGSITTHVLESSPMEKTCTFEKEKSVVEEDLDVNQDLVSEYASVTVISDEDSSSITANILESSPTEKACNLESEESVLEDSSAELNICSEDQDVESIQDLGVKLAAEDEYCSEVSNEIQSEVDEGSSSHAEVWDFGYMKDSIQECLSSLETEKCNPADALLDGEVFDEIPSGNEKSNENPPEELKCLDSCPTEKSVTDRLEDIEKFSPNTDVDVDAADHGIAAVDTTTILGFEASKTDGCFPLLDSGMINDSDTNNSIIGNAIPKLSCASFTDPISSPSRATAPNPENLPNQVQVTPLKSSSKQVTPLKSSNKKKATPIPRMIIEVLDDNKENSNSGSMILRNKSKLTTVIVDEKENNNNNSNKGNGSTQGALEDKSMKQVKALEDKSMRQLKKMLKLKTVDNTTNNKNQVIKEQQQLEKKRSVLQTLTDNCLVLDREN